MSYELLPWILDQESESFQKIENKWRPTDLLTELQSSLILKGITKRYQYLKEAESELVTLDRADQYITLLRQIGLTVKEAVYTRRSNQLKFLSVVADFYTYYGKSLRLLKIDQDRGKFTKV